FVEHEEAERNDELAFLRQRNEVGRRNDAALRMTPPRQRFDPDDAAGGDIHLRLIFEEYFVSADRLAQFLRLGQRRGYLVWALTEIVERVATEVLGLVEGGVGTCDQLFRSFPVERKGRDANACGNRDLLVAEVNGADERFVKVAQPAHDAGVVPSLMHKNKQ